MNNNFPDFSSELHKTTHNETKQNAKAMRNIKQIWRFLFVYQLLYVKNSIYI